MALYQAAASKVEISNSSANALEESGACRIPRGLASVKNQFEKEAQHQYQHKSLQKMTSQSQTMMSRRRTETSINEATSKGMQLEAFQSEKVTHQGQASVESKKTSTITQNIDKTGIDACVKEEIPKISTQYLKQHFEKTTQGKTFHSGRENGTAPKQIKIENGYQEMVWPSANFHSSAEATSTSREQGTYMARKTEQTLAASTPAYNKFPKYGSTEEFPPPPSPDLLQVPSEMTEFSQSPEPPLSPSKKVFPKDLYSRQRNLYELNRLYKHIHPELRKNLEQDYFKEISDIVSGSNTEMDSSVVGDVLQAKKAFENRENSPQKSMSPEREYLEWDEILKGEVQSIKWIFENQPLDSIKDESPNQNNVKSIAGQEIIAGGDVKYTTWMFETQPIDALSANFSDDAGMADRIPDLARGDVRTATWMFETQPLDSMNKIHHEQEEEFNETSVNEITGGDVKTVKYMFETQNLDRLGQLDSVEEAKLLQLRSELKEMKGDVKRSIRHFETLPLYVIRNNSGQMLEIKTVHREDVERGDVKTVRWMFETQPLDVINKEVTEIKVVHGISMEENIKGEVSKAKWLFETQPLDTIKESEESAGEKEIVLGTDVCRKCWLFETQPLDTLKENEDPNLFPAVEIIGGDVNTTKHLFETLPMDMLKDSPEVEKLQKMAAIEEEKGDVKHQKWIFETKPLEQIREERKEFVRTVKLEEVDKGDVSSCKQAFEMCCLSQRNDSNKIQVEGVTRGAVKCNKDIFETTPLYAIQDNLGKYHKVKTIRQEEVIQGDVRNCRWLFETRPIDQFDESIEKIEIIKGITSKEVQSGDVKTAKWLFETQPLDSIKYFSNVEEEESKPQTEATEVVKGDVRMCKWLFETQPMESLYEKETTVTNTDEMQRGDVKTCSLLFETQSLDAIGAESETANKLHTVEQEDIQGSDVRTACFLFETEKLENIQGEEDKELKRIVEIDIQPGDVSTMKYKFETQPLDSLSINSEEVLSKIKTIQSEDIQKGNVLHCCWLFENRSLGEISEDKERTSTQTITDVQDGHVRNGCFIFETFSLDQIKDEESVDENIKKAVNQEEITKGDVKSYKMLFETRPLYAIQDKEGYYHEVTTVKKEEVIHGDVRGTRWLFETKPLGSINESENVYIIKSVTQEDIQKGNVSSVRYRFETEPLDMISDEEKFVVPTVNSVQGGNVKANKKLFESEGTQGDKYVRTVNVSEIQQGNVKTCTWLFETHTIDEIRGEDSEYKGIQTVTREEVEEGDVQQAVWLFENQPLDFIKESDDTETKIDEEEIPQADVKTTTWLFETTPFHEFNENRIEKEEIIGKSVKETLKELYSQKVVETHGIILEADEIGDVRMAKYKLMNQEVPEIQKEEIIKGDLASIMISLLSKRSTLERETKVNEDEKGNVNLTKKQLMNSSTAVHVEKEEVVRGDIQQAIKKLFNKDRSVKRGILIQESEKGDINMTIYSLFHKKESNKVEQGEVMGGDVKRTIHSLLSSVMNHETPGRPKIDDSERGNVQFFTTCIEAGALDYLKLLQSETNETFASKNQDEEEEIMGGDVEGTKLLLKKKKSQIQRTVNETDIIPGDVSNALKIFTTEAQNTSCHVDKEEIIKGDLKTTLNSLSQAINQTAVTEKEEIAKADIHAILKSLQEAVYQPREREKPEVIPGDIKQTIESLEKGIQTKNQVLKEEVVQNDLEPTLRSLKAVQQSFKEADKEVVRGNTQTAIESLLDTSEETISRQCQRFTEAESKRSNEMLMKPSRQLVQNKVNPTEHLKNNDTFLQKEAMSQKKSFLIEDATAIHLDQRWNTKSQEMETKNMKALSKSQHKVTEKADTSVDKVTAKRHKDQYVIDQSTFCNNVEESERSEESEASRILMKAHSTNDMQSSEQMTGKKQNIFHEYKDEKYVDGRSQGETKAKSVQPTRDHQSFNYRGTSEQLNNRSTGLISKAASRLETKEVQQDKKQSQHSREVCRGKKNNVMASQTQVSMASEQNAKNNQKVRVTQEMHKQFKEAERKQKWSEKSILKYSGKSKVEGADEDLRVQVKNPGNPYKNPKGSDRSEIDSPSPPPPPPPPPPAPPLPLTSSEVDFPLPPPPPHLLTPCDRQRFPSPPSPTEGVKTEHESSPPPPPPPTTEEKYDNELTSHLPPSPLPQPKEHFFKSLDKSVQSQNKIPYNTKHLQTELIKELEASQCKASRKMQPRIIQMDKEIDKANTMDERTECSMLRNTVSHERKEKNVCAKTEDVKRVASVMESIGLETSLSNKAFPHFRSPSLPAEATQASPKPNVRKFKTPLMIAEEKYKLQKEQMEQKQAKDVGQLHVRRNSETWGRGAQAKSEGDLPVPKSYKQDEITRLSPSEVPATPIELECQRKPPVTNSEADDLQPLPKQSMAEQSQKVSKCWAEEHIRKKAVHESQHLTKQSVSEKVQTHQEHVMSRKEQHQREQLHVSKNKPVCPSFKVRTIQDPACDHTLPKGQRDSIIHKKQEGSSVHGVRKQDIQEKQKEKISEESAAGNCMKTDGKIQVEKTLYKYSEGREEIGDKESSGMKQRLIQRKETEKEEKNSSAMEGQESQVIAHLKEEKGIVQRKEQPASSKSEKMVKQKIINIHNKFQAVHSEPQPTFVFETNVRNKNLSQGKNNLQGQGEYIREITPEQQKSPHKTPEPKKELVQEKRLPSSLPRGSLQKCEKNSVDVLELLRKREEIQQLLSRMKEFEMEPSKKAMKTFQVFLSVIPGWLVEQEKKQELRHIAQEDSVEKMREELSVIKDQASKILHSCEEAIQAAMISTNSLKCKKNVHSTGGSTQKMAKVTTGSSKKDSQKTKEMSQDTMAHEKVKEKVGGNRFSEIRTSSPSLRTRAPSPTYITIESRCIESPLRDLLSPVQRESTPVPPSPPPRSTTPASRIQQSSARSEQLAKLKDTTVKLSQGAIPNRSVTPIPIVEKRSEIVKSPATLRRQIKIDTRQPDICKVPFANDTHVTAEAVTKVKEMHEESQVNQMYISRKGGSIPEEPHGQSTGSISIAHRFEVPKAGPKGLRHRYEASDQVIHIRKEPDLPETFGSDIEYKTDRMSQTFNDQALSEGKSKNKSVENGTMSDKSKEVRYRSRKGRLSQTSQDQDNKTNNFQKSPGKHQRESKETNSKKQNQCAIKEHSCEPRACLDAKSPVECSYGMESFENMVIESRTATSTAQNTDGTKSGFGFKRAPPTYEDVISGHILDIAAPDSPEDLLRNFQKTWQESERVFQSLGYTMSEATEAEVRSSFHEEAEFISETATPGKGNMPTLSKESLSNGVPSGRQANFP